MHVKTKQKPLYNGFCYGLLIGILWLRKETLLYTMFIVIIKINCKDFIESAAFLSRRDTKCRFENHYPTLEMYLYLPCIFMLFSSIFITYLFINWF